MKKLLTTLFTPLTILYFTGSILLFIAVPTHAQTYTVERVIDGDTILVTDGKKSMEVDLIGIDAPPIVYGEEGDAMIPEGNIFDEAKKWSKDFDEVEKMGQEATEFVKGLVKSGQELRLEFDVQAKDKYGRLLAYVYSLICRNCEVQEVSGYEYKRTEDAVYLNLNSTIIRQGYATPMTIPPNVNYADLFKELYEEAREQKRGLWNE